ncbi:MAG: biotin/lipoyl-binding protein, partial [Rickettsiales bacterium]|nr:biotin/lipoyl-binding protein [Rickettsiales bacterium]
APIEGAVTSPMVGVVYLSPEPAAKPFAAEGAKVMKGDTLCLVEAMKTFNPIKAPKDGLVAEVLVKDGETVEFGTPLVVIK